MGRLTDLLEEAISVRDSERDSGEAPPSAPRRGRGARYVGSGNGKRIDDQSEERLRARDQSREDRAQEIFQERERQDRAPIPTPMAGVQLSGDVGAPVRRMFRPEAAIEMYRSAREGLDRAGDYISDQDARVEDIQEGIQDAGENIQRAGSGALSYIRELPGRTMADPRTPMRDLARAVDAPGMVRRAIEAAPGVVGATKEILSTLPAELTYAPGARSQDASLEEVRAQVSGDEPRRRGAIREQIGSGISHLLNLVGGPTDVLDLGALARGAMRGRQSVEAAQQATTARADAQTELEAARAERRQREETRAREARERDQRRQEFQRERDARREQERQSREQHPGARTRIGQQYRSEDPYQTHTGSDGLRGRTQSEEPLPPEAWEEFGTPDEGGVPDDQLFAARRPAVPDMGERRPAEGFNLARIESGLRTPPLPQHVIRHIESLDQQSAEMELETLSRLAGGGAEDQNRLREILGQLPPGQYETALRVRISEARRAAEESLSPPSSRAPNPNAPREGQIIPPSAGTRTETSIKRREQAVADDPSLEHLRPVRTEEERLKWGAGSEAEEGAIIFQSSDSVGMPDIYSFRAPRGGIIDVAVEGDMDQPMSWASVSFQDRGRGRRRDVADDAARGRAGRRGQLRNGVYDRQAAYAPDEWRALFERILAVVSLDARKNQRDTYHIVGANPILDREYRTQVLNAQRGIYDIPEGYSIRTGDHGIFIIREAPRRPERIDLDQPRFHESDIDAIARKPLKGPDDGGPPLRPGDEVSSDKIGRHPPARLVSSEPNAARSREDLLARRQELVTERSKIRWLRSLDAREQRKYKVDYASLGERELELTEEIARLSREERAATPTDRAAARWNVNNPVIKGPAKNISPGAEISADDIGRHPPYKGNPDEPRENLSAGPQAGGLRDRPGISPGEGSVSAPGGRGLEADARPLFGSPARVKIPGTGWVSSGPNPKIRNAARAYAKQAGISYQPATTYAKVDIPRARRIAQAYEEMRHAPNDPEVRQAYEAMARETLAQYQHVKKAGLKVDFIDLEKGVDPYAMSPRLAIEDINNNNHMWVFATDDGYGEVPITQADIDDNPMLALTDEMISGRRARVNDIFRVVHDYFGHAKDGVGMRATGEENAWRSHAAMYSPQARRAMTSETRGQNSWLNYGPNGEANRAAKTEDTVFAEQKVGLLPEWVAEEGRLDPSQRAEIQFSQSVDEMISEIDGAKASLKDRPESLSQWVRRQGGISDDRGEVTRTSDGRRGFARLTNRVSGKPADRLRESAIEERFLPEDASLDDFLRALDEDSSGSRVVRESDLASEEAYDQARATIDHYESRDIDTSLNGDRLRDAITERFTERAPKFDPKTPRGQPSPGRAADDGRRQAFIQATGGANKKAIAQANLQTFPSGTRGENLARAISRLLKDERGAGMSGVKIARSEDGRIFIWNGNAMSHEGVEDALDVVLVGGKGEDINAPREIPAALAKIRNQGIDKSTGNLQRGRPRTSTYDQAEAVRLGTPKDKGGEGLTATEIGKRLNVNQSTVYALLRNRLGDDGFARDATRGRASTITKNKPNGERTLSERKAKAKGSGIVPGSAEEARPRGGPGDRIGMKYGYQPGDIVMGFHERSDDVSIGLDLGLDPETVQDVGNIIGVQSHAIRTVARAAMKRPGGLRALAEHWYVTEDALRDFVENVGVARGRTNSLAAKARDLIAKGVTGWNDLVRELRRINPDASADTLEATASKARLAMGADLNPRQQHAGRGNAKNRKAGGGTASAVALAAGAGGAAALLQGGEAQAQEASPASLQTASFGNYQVDMSADLPPVSQRIGQPMIDGEFYIEEYADGSHYLFRMNRDQGSRADPEYLGKVIPEDYNPAQFDGQRGFTPSQGSRSLPDRMTREESPERPGWLAAVPAIAGVLGGRLGLRGANRANLRFARENPLQTRALAGAGAGAVAGATYGAVTPEEDMLDTTALGATIGAAGAGADIAASRAIPAARGALADVRLPSPRSRAPAARLRPPEGRARDVGSLDENAISGQMEAMRRGGQRPQAATPAERRRKSGPVAPLESRLDYDPAEPHSPTRRLQSTPAPQLRLLARELGLESSGPRAAVAARIERFMRDGGRQAIEQIRRFAPWLIVPLAASRVGFREEAQSDQAASPR